MTTEEVKKKAAAGTKKEKKVVKAKDLTVDPATVQMIERSRELEIETIFDRAQSMKP